MNNPVYNEGTGFSYISPNSQKKKNRYHFYGIAGMISGIVLATLLANYLL